jgi:hypothetical protein
MSGARHRRKVDRLEREPLSRLQSLLKGWRKLSRSGLEQRILHITRLAGQGIHLCEKDWRIVDRMRAAGRKTSCSTNCEIASVSTMLEKRSAATLGRHPPE